MIKVGFVGLGNVGMKLAGSLLRNRFDLTVLDLNENLVDALVSQGAQSTSSPRELMESVDYLITCLPSPKISAEVMESKENGVLLGMSPGKVWMEMSTTDQKEVCRLGQLVFDKGGLAVDCPVSGGCHRADTGNISIFAGCIRETFDKIFPLLKVMGRRVLHTGDLGSASILKVVTNYLATANLVSLAEALIVSKKSGLDLNLAYEAIRISSGNSFVHETESQVILNGSRNISFTMDLVLKDIGLFQKIADDFSIPLEISPKLIEIFTDGIVRYGERELSPNIIKRLEEFCQVEVKGKGFPAEMVDDEPEEEGFEVIPKN